MFLWSENFAMCRLFPTFAAQKDIVNCKSSNCILFDEPVHQILRRRSARP